MWRRGGSQGGGYDAHEKKERGGGKNTLGGGEKDPRPSINIKNPKRGGSFLDLLQKKGGKKEKGVSHRRGSNQGCPGRTEKGGKGGGGR